MEWWKDESGCTSINTKEEIGQKTSQNGDNVSMITHHAAEK